MQPQTTLKLAEETGNIIAVKEASGDMEQVNELIAGRPDGFHVLSGDDALAVPLIEKGGRRAYLRRGQCLSGLYGGDGGGGDGTGCEALAQVVERHRGA